MNRYRSFPGARLLLSLAGLVGLFRAVEHTSGQPRRPEEPIDSATRFEHRDVNATAVFLTGIGVLVLVWAVVVLVYPLFSYFQNQRGAPAAAVTQIPSRPPEPRIQADPRADLHDFRARESAQLSTYRWVNRKERVISIPIDRAIQLLSQRGVPPSQPGEDKYYDPHAGSRETGFEGKVEPEPR